MTTTKTRVHIICGICGNNEFMSYDVKENHQVRLHCGNCSSVTILADLVAMTRIKPVMADGCYCDYDYICPKCKKG